MGDYAIANCVFNETAMGKMLASIAFKGESFKWNHALAFLFLVAAVYLVFKK